MLANIQLQLQSFTNEGTHASFGEGRMLSRGALSKRPQAFTNLGHPKAFCCGNPTLRRQFSTTVRCTKFWVTRLSKLGCVARLQASRVCCPVADMRASGFYAPEDKMQHDKMQHGRTYDYRLEGTQQRMQRGIAEQKGQGHARLTIQQRSQNLKLPHRLMSLANYSRCQSGRNVLGISQTGCWAWSV